MQLIKNTAGINAYVNATGIRSLALYLHVRV